MLWLVICAYRFEHQRLDKVSNDQIYDLTGTSPLLSTVISRQLTFLGHILRMEKDESAIKILALSKPSHGRRPSGIPQKSQSNSGNGSTTISISQSMTSCALPKTEPVGDDPDDTNQ